MLNLFQQLTNKHRLMKGLCLLLSNEDGQMLKQERRFFIQSQSLTPARAFSVAEAMIALLIGSLILGYSAPMIAKQIKHNYMVHNDVDFS